MKEVTPGRFWQYRECSSPPMARTTPCSTRSACHSSERMKIVKIRILGRNLPMTLVELRRRGHHRDRRHRGASAIIRHVVEHPPWKLASVLLDQDPSKSIRLRRLCCMRRLPRAASWRMPWRRLDMALWDLHGKVRQLPLHKLFAAQAVSRVPVYAGATAYDVSRGLQPPLRFKSTNQLVAEAKAGRRRGV